MQNVTREAIGGAEQVVGYRAMITLLLQDPGSTYANTVPFLVDTGAEFTIVPRGLLRERAFPRDKSTPRYEVTGLGGAVIGEGFPARLAILADQPRQPPFDFGTIQIVVADGLRRSSGVLGLDALRKLIVVCDEDHISFWAPPAGTCRAEERRT